MPRGARLAHERQWIGKMSVPDSLGTLLAAVFLLGVPVYLAMGVPLGFWQARRRARQGRFTRRWAWGVSSAFVAGPTLLLGLLIACDLATRPASAAWMLFLGLVPLLPILIWAACWWLTLVGGGRGAKKDKPPAG